MSAVNNKSTIEPASAICSSMPVSWSFNSLETYLITGQDNHPDNEVPPYTKQEYIAAKIALCWDVANVEDADTSGWHFDPKAKEYFKTIHGLNVHREGIKNAMIECFGISPGLIGNSDGRGTLIVTVDQDLFESKAPYAKRPTATQHPVGTLREFVARL